MSDEKPGREDDPRDAELTDEQLDREAPGVDDAAELEAAEDEIAAEAESDEDKVVATPARRRRGRITADDDEDEDDDEPVAPRTRRPDRERTSSRPAGRGPPGRTLAGRPRGPVHWPPGAADPATGVPRNLPRLRAAVVRRAVPGPAQGTRGVAQLAEQRSPKPQAAGSSPVTPATARQVPTDHPVAHPSDRHHEASEAQ